MKYIYQQFKYISLDKYLEMGQVHTSKDREIDEEDVKRRENVLNGHVSMLLKMSRMGESWNHEERMRESNIKHSMYTSPMYLLVKDHKLVEKGGEIPTRPVVSANEGIGTSLSTILSEFLEPLADSLEDRMEVISTEDYLNRLTECNKKIEEEWKEGEELTHIGADAKALFPSLSAERSARIVREVAMESELEFVGMDYKAAAMLVKYGMDPSEIRTLGLENIVPRRRYNRGRKPGVTSKEALGGDRERDEDKWIFPSREPSETEKKSLIAACLEIGVRTSFQNSVYQFGGKYFLQSTGGPIGARVTMAVSRIVMYQWGKNLQKILREAEVKIWMDSLYVDDYRTLITALRPGLRWDQEKGKLQFREEWRDEDLKSEISTTRRSATVLKAAMESINPDIKFEIELEEDFPDKKLPTLDTCVWLDRSPDIPPKFNFSFFEKKMNSSYVILEKSAMSMKQKYAILSQEVVRRMLNTRTGTKQQDRNDILNRYSQKLLRSGYRIPQVREILISGIRSYQRRLKNAESKKVNLYRSAKSSLGERIRKKLFEKTSWFKERERKRILTKRTQNSSAQKRKPGPQLEIKSVMFVPRSEKGELLKRLKEEESKLADLTGYRVRLVERSGTQLSRILCQRNPWAGEDCSRPDCLVCGDGEAGGGDCRRRNITYITTCITCLKNKKEGVTEKGPAQYVGESARSAYERGREHLDGYKQGKEENHMMKHRVMDHPGENVIFRMKVLAKHRSAFERQVTEAVLIEMKEKDGLLLNSKGGFNRCALPRLQVAIGDKAWEKDLKEKEREKAYLENIDEENRVVKVDGRKKASDKTSADSLKLPNRPKFKAKKSKKNFIPNNFKFIPLSKVFDLTERKPDLGGPDDRGSRLRDKRRAGDG